MIVALVFLAGSLAAPAEAAAPPAKKICRKLTNTGSILGKRTCRTPEEWAALDEGEVKKVRRFDDETRIGVGPAEGAPR